MESKFEFEFGISFLSKDELVAKKISDELKLHASTYFYRDHQRKQIFQNGVEVYSDSFQNKIRFAIILYRQEWGKSGITSIEKTAIQEILMDEERGVDHIFLITLDGKKPNWWGANIYEKYVQSKFQIIIGNILYMHKKIGGKIDNVDAIEKIKILKEKAELKRERNEFINQPHGKVLEFFTKEYEILTTILKIKIQEIKDEFNLQSEEKQLNLINNTHSYLICNSRSVFNSLLFRVYIYHIYKSSSTLDGSILYIYAGEQFTWGGGIPPSNKNYKFTINDLQQCGWELKSEKDSFYTSKEVIEDLFQILYTYFSNTVNSIHYS